MKELVLVTRKCCFCQREAQVYMPRAAFERWQAGELIQFAWPGSTPAEREIAISGTHPSCFDKVYAYMETSWPDGRLKNLPQPLGRLTVARGARLSLEYSGSWMIDKLGWAEKGDRYRLAYQTEGFGSYIFSSDNLADCLKHIQAIRNGESLRVAILR